MNLPFPVYIFQNSIKNLIREATILFQNKSTTRGLCTLNKLTCCTSFHVENQPEYVNKLMQDLVNEIEEIKYKKSTIKSKRNYSHKSKKKSSKKKSKNFVSKKSILYR